MFVQSGWAEEGLRPCAGIEAENFQRVVLFLAFVLKGVKLFQRPFAVTDVLRL